MSELNIEAIVEAIDKYRMKNGLRWKSKLKDEWFSNSNFDGHLMRFRNHYGFNILDKIKYHTTKREISSILKKAKG